MSKKIAFGSQPKKDKQQVVSPDDWVNQGAEENSNAANPAAAATFDAAVAASEPSPVPTVRYTIDLPVELHTRIKTECARRRKRMNHELVALLEEHFPPTQDAA